MKVFEIIYNLFEMAFNRKDVESKVTSLSLPLIKHLIKILKWKDDINYNKHIGDMNSWLYDIQGFSIKGNKKPSQYDYYQWIFTDVAKNEQTISRYIKGLHHYHSLQIIRTDEEVYDIIKSIIYKLSFDLPLDNFDNIEDYL